MIPFTQYLRPGGRKTQVTIDLPEDVEKLAWAYIKKGGRYEAEILVSDEVSLTAVYYINGEDQDIAIEVVPNGPAVGTAVERIVRHSIKFIEERYLIDNRIK